MEKKLFFQLVLLVFNVAGLHSQAISNYPGEPWEYIVEFTNPLPFDCSTQFGLVWHDEFNDSSLDLAEWKIGTASQPPFDRIQNLDTSCKFDEAAGFSLSNIQMTPNPSPFDNHSGYMTIKTIKEPITVTGPVVLAEDLPEGFDDCFTIGSPLSATCGYSSASIETINQRFDLDNTTAVKIEARIRHSENIFGTWPAFWLWQHKEIDIFEFFAISNEFQNNIHSEANHPTTGGKLIEHGKIYSGAVFSDWNVWGLEWTRFELRFYLNGNLIRREKKFSRPKYGGVLSFPAVRFIFLSIFAKNIILP